MKTAVFLVVLAGNAVAMAAGDRLEIGPQVKGPDGRSLFAKVTDKFTDEVIGRVMLIRKGGLDPMLMIEQRADGNDSFSLIGSWLPDDPSAENKRKSLSLRFGKRKPMTFSAFIDDHGCVIYGGSAMTLWALLHSTILVRVDKTGDVYEYVIEANVHNAAWEFSDAYFEKRQAKQIAEQVAK